MNMEQGCVQVYTGNGKGKTTASLGLALRASGHGYRVCIVQFMKGGGPYGEHAALSRLAPEVTTHITGRAGWVKKGDPNPADIAEAQRGVALVSEAIEKRDYDILILDEINGAVDLGLVAVETVLELLKRRPAQMEMVLTGRNADSKILAAADLVTEMREHKHYFASGVPAREGIER